MGNVELTSGELRLDDLSLPQIDLADIRRNATLLTQEARLFHGTLRENVTLGRPMASDDELVKVLELCGALEFVNKLPMGLEHLVMEGGLGLSGRWLYGQKRWRPSPRAWRRYAAAGVQ